jgi:hypothetical protein
MPPCALDMPFCYADIVHILLYCSLLHSIQHFLYNYFPSSVVLCGECLLRKVGALEVWEILLSFPLRVDLLIPALAGCSAILRICTFRDHDPSPSFVRTNAPIFGLAMPHLVPAYCDSRCRPCSRALQSIWGPHHGTARLKRALLSLT